MTEPACARWGLKSHLTCSTSSLGCGGYSTQLWLRHTEPSIDETQSRWPLSDVWQVVQESAVYGNPTPLLRAKKIELDADRAMAGFVGYATSWAVRSGLPLSVVQEDGGGFMEWSFEPMQAYLEQRKDATFGE